MCLLLVYLNLLSSKALAPYVTYMETKGNVFYLSQKKCLTMALVKLFVFLRGCSYGGERARLGGMLTLVRFHIL